MEKAISKKGQIGDLATVIVGITIIAITMLIAGYLYQQVDIGLDDSGLESNESAEAYDAFAVAFPMFDKAMMFIIGAMIIGLIISSLYIPTHPIFIVLNIFGFLVLVFLGAVFSNLYGEMIIQPGLSNVTYYPITTYLMSILPWIGAIVTAISTFIMYGKSRG